VFHIAGQRSHGFNGMGAVHEPELVFIFFSHLNTTSILPYIPTSLSCYAKKSLQIIDMSDTMQNNEIIPPPQGHPPLGPLDPPQSPKKSTHI